MGKQDIDDFANFLIGKTISGVRDGPDGFDLIFTDGSEIEFYAVGKRFADGSESELCDDIEHRFAYCTLTPEEAAAEMAELNALEARIETGEERTYSHDEVWNDEGQDAET